MCVGLAVVLAIAAAVREPELGYILILGQAMVGGLVLGVVAWLLFSVARPTAFSASFLAGLVAVTPLVLLTVFYSPMTDIGLGIAERLDRMERERPRYEIPLGEGKSVYFRNPNGSEFPSFSDFNGVFETSFDVKGQRELSAEQVRRITQDLLRERGEHAWKLSVQPTRTYYEKGYFSLRHPATLEVEMYFGRPLESSSPDRVQCLVMKDGRFQLGKITMQTWHMDSHTRTPYPPLR